MEEFVIREVRTQDAAMLARCWNEERDAWPGDFGGPEHTEEIIRRQLRNWGYLKFFVAASSNRIIGSSVLQEHDREKHACYVAHLGVLKKFHGKKFGKRLLLAAVNAGIAAGYKRIDLDTWPANLKAVPLYKKTGFFWIPDTRVSMQNFLPTIFADPIAKRYFAKHDWYDTLKRDLRLKEDKTEIRGRKVFVYEWAADGDHLRVVIDCESGGICEITDGDLAIATWAEQKPIIGIPQKIHWRLRKRSRGSVPVALTAHGEEGVTLDLRKSFSLQGRKEVHASFRIDPEIKRKDDGTAYQLRSQLIIGGEVSELSTGLRPKRAVELHTEPRNISLVPGQTADLTICLLSNLKKSAKGKLRLMPPEGLHLECPDSTFTIPAEGTAGVTVRVTTQSPGVFLLRAQAELSADEKRLKSKMEDFHITSSEPGQIVSYQHEDAAVVENDFLRVWARAFGAYVGFEDKLTNKSFGGLHPPELGPPYWPSEFAPKKFNLSLSTTANGATVELSAKSDKFPGITLTRTVTVGSGPLIKVNHRAINKGTRSHDLKLQLNTWTNKQNARITLPTSEGLLSDYVGVTDYPNYEAEEFPAKPEEMNETWIAYESEGMVLGLIWKECERVPVAWPGLEISLGKLAPGAESSHAPVYIYAGPGDWRAVRAMWQRHIQKPAQKPDKPPKTREVRTVTIEPTPIIASSTKAKAKVSLTALTKLAHEGALELTPPRGWSVSPRRLEFKGVNADNSYERAITLSTKRKPRADAAELIVRWSMKAEDRELSFPFICTSPGRKGISIRPKQVEGLHVFVIDNGRIALHVSPDFMGSLFALEEDGTNHLYSAFPEPGELLWEKPWYGGVHPFLGGRWFPGGLFDKEKFRCEPVRRVGVGKWAGVRVTTNVNRPGCKRLGVRVEYLTLPESNIVAVRTHIQNRSTAHFRSRGLIRSNLQVGGDRRKTVLHYELGRLRARRRSNLRLRLGGRNWAAVENPHRKRCIVMIDASDDSSISMQDLYKEGAHLSQVADIHVGPLKRRTFLCYLVLTDGAEKAQLYSSLQNARAL